MKALKALGVLCLVVLTSAPVYAALPNLIPNSTKYKDAGAKAATGRSGSAAIEVRALRGRGDTTIEVTTGEIDSTVVPPGKLDKVQLKVYAANGTLLVTDNYRKSLTTGGYGNFVYDWVSRGQSVQAQASVSGIDPSRTDMVTVSTPVKFRPDLKVGDLQNPATAKIHAPVGITATIREGNGDVGARANCVLRVDGVEVDRANGIWVDAGDSVACEFTTHFDSVGAKQITVEATDVVPGDYDTSNNSVSGQVNVIPVDGPVNYFIGAYDSTTEGSNGYRHLDAWHYDDHPDWDYSWQMTNDTNMIDHIVSYQAYMSFNRKVTFPLHVDTSLTSDGQIVVQDAQDLDVTSSYGDSTYLTQCSTFEDYFDQPRSFSICSTTMNNGTASTSLSTWTQSRLLTYHSTQTSAFRAYGIDDVYTMSWDTEYPYGQQPVPSLGNHISVQAAITDAVQTINDIDASVDLNPLPDYIIPFTEDCTTFDSIDPDGAHYTGYDCYSYSLVTHTRQGFAQGVDTW